MATHSLKTEVSDEVLEIAIDAVNEVACSSSFTKFFNFHELDDVKILEEIFQQKGYDSKMTFRCSHICDDSPTCTKDDDGDVKNCSHVCGKDMTGCDKNDPCELVLRIKLLTDPLISSSEQKSGRSFIIDDKLIPSAYQLIYLRESCNLDHQKNIIEQLTDNVEENGIASLNFTYDMKVLIEPIVQELNTCGYEYSAFSTLKCTKTCSHDHVNPLIWEKDDQPCYHNHNDGCKWVLTVIKINSG